MSKLSAGISERLSRQGEGQGSRDPEGWRGVARSTEVRRKAFFVGGLILCALLLPLLIINLTLAIEAALQPEKAPSVFGYTPLVVLTDSMYPTISSGSLIVTERTDPSTLAVGENGDIVSFYSGESVVTHRAVERKPSDSGGDLYVTKGDINPAPDINPVSPDQIIGVVGPIIPGLGSTILFFQSPAGMLAIVAVLLVMIAAVFITRNRTASLEGGG